MTTEADKMLKAAEIMAEAVRLFAETSAMNAENDSQKGRGKPAIYDESSYITETRAVERKVEEIRER